jgi:hypothetical protein
VVEDEVAARSIIRVSEILSNKAVTAAMAAWKYRYVDGMEQRIEMM